MSSGRSLIFIFLLLASVARAQQNNALTLVLSVEDDGGIIASERLAFSAPMRHPLHWRIPTAITSPLGVRRLLFVDVLEISDGRGNLLSSAVRHYGNALEVVIPAQPLADNAVRITYSVRNAVRFRDAADELLWPVGQQWSEPFQEVSANIAVPAAAAGQVGAQLLRQDAGSRVVMPLPLSGRRATWEIVSAQPRRGLLDLVFAPGVLRQPSILRRSTWFVQANPIVLFVSLLLLAAGLFRWFAARDRAAGISVVPRYEPPADLPPAEAGVLIDDRLDPRDLASMLLDLARRGFIRIEPGTPDEGVPYSAPDFILRLIKPMDDWKGAYPYEHILLFHTFYGGQWTKLSSVSLRFYAVVPDIARIIRDELQRKGLYAAPWRVAVLRVMAMLVLTAVFAVAQLAGWFAVAQSVTVALIALLCLALMVPLLTRGISHRSARGDAVFSELRGFQEFLNTVDADRMRRITPDLMESYLPYAVALGVEHHWGATFSTISTGPPLWWDKANPGGIPDFVRLVGDHPLPTRRGAARSRPPIAQTAKA